MPSARVGGISAGATVLTPRNLYLLATSSWFLAFGMQAVTFAWLVTIVLHEPAQMVGWAQTALLLPGCC